MMKHIIGQAVFQLMVMITLVFAAELFIPEYTDSLDKSTFASNPQWKWKDGKVGGNIRSGRFITIKGGYDYQTIYNNTGIYSRHFTFIFNTFVMMQIFNFMNCRKIHEQLNIFSGIAKNKLFIVIVVVIFVLQILLITFGGQGLHVYSNYGLTVQQWIISVLIGSISLPVNLLIKQFPVKEDSEASSLEKH